MTEQRPLNFPKSHRLLNANAFDDVFKNNAFRASHRYCLVLAKTNIEHGPRLGLVIAKKHIRLAVERNRIKRLVRESFRQQQHQLPKIDAIVLARKGLGELDNSDIISILDKLWQKLANQVNPK